MLLVGERRRGEGQGDTNWQTGELVADYLTTGSPRCPKQFKCKAWEALELRWVRREIFLSGDETASRPWAGADLTHDCHQTNSFFCFFVLQMQHSPDYRVVIFFLQMLKHSHANMAGFSQNTPHNSQNPTPKLQNASYFLQNEALQPNVRRTLSDQTVAANATRVLHIARVLHTWAQWKAQASSLFTCTEI